MSQTVLLVLGLLLSSVLAEPCLQETLHHCTCVNVSHSELQCPDTDLQQFLFQTEMSEGREVRRLECGPGVDRTVLEEIQESQVGQQSVSVSMVGCTTHRLCTPVQRVTFSLQSFIYHIFSSFSYTYTKGNTLKHLDLIGCTALENPESLETIKNITKAEAVSVFHLTPGLGGRGRLFKKYIHFQKRQRSEMRNSTNQRTVEGINVDLSGREIARVSQDAFWSEVTNIYHIEMLNLSHNSIHQLAHGFFPNSTFTNTKYLDLSFNLLSSLEQTMLQNLTSLADLNLAGNRLQVLSEGIFVNNPLERLDLSNNLLVVLEDNTLSNALNLEWLDLSNNKLRSISLKSDNNFRRLSTLNVACNSLRAMDESWKRDYPTLRLLNVSHNSIGPVISETDLEFVKRFHGMTLDISFNNIQTVRIDKEPRSKSEPYQTIYLDLKGNPIKCDCSATDLKAAVDGKLSRRYFHLISEAVLCVSGSSLLDTDYHDLNCPLADPGGQCSRRGCSCSRNEHFKQVSINCSSTGLTDFPVDLIEIAEENYAINLDLRDNKIKELPSKLNMTNYSNIKALDITGNNLESVDHRFLPQHLNFLSLRNNRITFLSEQTVNFLENKSNFQIKLGGNPYSCNCRAEFLHNLMNSHNGKMVEDRDDILLHCPGETVQIIKARTEQFCISIDKTLLPILASLTTIIAIFFVLATLFLVYKQRIIIFLYSKSWARLYFNEDFVDRDKHYDAFISYSHEDRDFVENTLVQGLERAQDSELRYKVCVHSRDWNVGEDIPSQIFRSVEDSRKTIIVLSQSYVESKWSDLEFKAAHKKALTDKIQRVIIIKHGELSLNTEMFHDLSSYMKMNTYLDSRDPWFWPKLRYTLPHRRKVSGIGERIFWTARGQVSNV